MHAVRRRVYRSLLSPCYSPSPLSSSYITTLTQGSPEPLRWRDSASSPLLRTLSEPWAAIQRRGAKVLGSEVRTGNVIQRKGRAYQVLKAQHTQHGRGGATIQVELRDIDSGSKVIERFRTDEVLEEIIEKILYTYLQRKCTAFEDAPDDSLLIKLGMNMEAIKATIKAGRMVFVWHSGVRIAAVNSCLEVLVEDKSLTVLYQEGDSVVLMDPSTFEQLEVSKDLFGKNSSYLKEEMNVTVQCYDGKPTSGSVPQRLTCIVVEAQPHTKGLTAAPQYKKVVLDNGLTVMVPPFIEAGDEIVLNTTEDKYLARAKE